MEVQQDKPFIIAYYLPQYHPIPENDEWWGKGFTEWTNVAKAKPLFKGHYQPKIPADLGFYDLRVPEVREQQAELAREAGVDGFCYWHYWFGNGKELLERPFKEVVESGKPDFPFCLGWANEDWEAKVWNINGTHHTKGTLIKQSPPSSADNEKHFYRYLKAFRDARYIRSNGRPIFVIYKPFLDGTPQFISDWNRFAQKEGLSDGFYFIGTAENESESESIIKMGFSAVTLNVNNRMCSPYKKRPFFIQKISEYLHWKLKKPVIIDYLKSSNFLWNADFDIQENFIPTILPNWDHSPRSGKSAIILKNATPESFKKLCLKTFYGIQQKRNKIVFLKSWNEWGEGNYMEPDLKYGKQYIKALYSAIMESSKSD